MDKVEETIKQVKARVANMLEVDEGSLNDTDSLEDQGLDSVRMVEIVSFLRSEGFDVDFADLIDDSTILNWKSLLAQSV